MKKEKSMVVKMASVLAMLILFVSFSASAQTHKHGSMKKHSTKMNHGTMMKDCCMMKDGKMMVMKNGVIMPMEKDMKMKNGTTCMTNGECKMKDGKKMMMKDGECMDMSGKMDNCAMMMKDKKAATLKKNSKHNMAITYSCPMHPEVTSDKTGKCPKCGMDLVEKK